MSPLQAMGAGLAVVPLMGLLETVAIAKAFGTVCMGPQMMGKAVSLRSLALSMLAG